jgi:hypothetical protein
MTEPPLFDLITSQPDDVQQCDRCAATRTATIDTLRVGGWIAYNGTSFTGKTLAVRICPDCRRKDHHDAASDRLEPVPQVHPRLPGTDR